MKKKTEDPNIWQDTKKFNQILKEINIEENIIKKITEIKKNIDDNLEFVELLNEDFNKEEFDELKNMVKDFYIEFEKFELESAFNEENDKNNAILTIKPGAGGTESQDWALMLLRMYIRWAERNNFEVKILDQINGEEAGIKSATINIIGNYAYGCLKGESGVHRLVRISPFDSNKRRHTSFAAVSVLPEIDDNIEIEIKPEELKIETFRASGAGGQYVNKTESAVRITHIPTGIVVSCQMERSQHKNRETALKILKSRLYQKKLEEKQKEKEQFQKEKKKIEWGSQIRSYILHPYNLVKDHRTGYETSNVKAVLDGEIDEFIKSYILNKK